MNEAMSQAPQYGSLIVAVLGFMVLWTTSIIGGMVWLSSQFSKNRAATYEAADELRKDFEAKFSDHGRRILNLEFWRVSKDGVAAFGMDMPPQTPPNGQQTKGN